MSRFIRELPEELVVWSDRGEASDGVDHGGAGTGSARVPRLARVKGPTIHSLPDDFVVGAWVEHKIFGKGQIAEREGVGDNLKLTVKFTDGKVKKLVARYANLNRL